MSNHQLVLLPRDPNAAPNHTPLVRCLADIDFLGDPMPEMNFYRPGEDFLFLLTFLGCSPVVSLGEPGVTADFCRIEVPAPSQTPHFFAGTNVKPPRCGKCSHRFEDWHGRVATWQQTGDDACTCPTCGRVQTLPALGWRQSAGFGRSPVRVWGIFEGEAVPGEKLLGALEALGGGPWTHFYYRAD
ncbi:MAG: hypothetical protein M0R77_11040 [Gammaproteobacteria bacterium]|nr:hypothetical protein [Gammaproteobacteria bacterium]